MLIKKPANILLLICLCIFSIAANAQSNDFANDRLIIKFKAKYNPVYAMKKGIVTFSIASIDALNTKYHCTSARKISGRKNKSQTYLLKFANDVDVNLLIRKYQKTGYLEYAEADHTGGRQGATSTTPNDSEFGMQWALYNNGSFAFDSAISGADIKMKQAWDIETGDSSIIVAIVDDGAKMDHPEFATRIWRNYAEIPGNNIDDDANGYVDDELGWNFAYSTNDPTDDEGHGTNVAGIIGANGNNNIGFAGVDWHCKLMILKGTDNTGHGFYSDWAEAIEYAADNGAKVINLSLGGSSSSIVLQDAINYAYNHNVTVVAAMGNGNDIAPSYPGACDHVIAVGATNDHDYRVSPFFWGGGSNYGAHISVVAPGNYIYGLHHLSNTTYTTYWGGTSQATPHVAGLAALLLAQNGSRTPDQVKQIIEATADDLVGKPTEDVAGWDQYYGHGRINAYRALTYFPASTPSVSYQNNGVEIYPNPGSGKINVHIASLNEAVQYSVTSITGAVVMNGVFNNSNNQIDLSGQPKGTYIIKLNNRNINYIQKEILQ